MATLQEINAKRKELMATGQYANEKEAAISARDQLTTPVTTPVTPTGDGATLTPPSPTQATNQAQLLENQANRKAMVQAGTVPAPNQPPQTPTPEPTPVTPQPTVPTPPQKPTKVESPIDYTQAKGREQDIVNNLNTFKSQGMTPEQIVKASDYANASPEKKALIEPYLKSTQPTASSLYNIIANKQEVPIEQKNSSAYRVANNRYQRVNQYVGMTPTEVNQAFTDGKIVEGSETWEDLKTLNPKLAQDALNLRKVNGNKTNIFTYVNNQDGTPVKVNRLEQNFTDQYIEDYHDIIELLKSVYNTPTYSEMKAQINTPEVVSAQDKANAIEIEMNSLQTAMDNVDKDVEKELLGSGATGSRIALEKSIRKAELQKQYDAKLRDYTTAYNKATNLINQNTEMFKYAQDQKKTMQNALAGVYNAQYQAQLGLQTKGAEMQMESDFAKKKAEEALNDPQTAITSVMEEYKKLGIPFTESIQTKVAKAEDFISKGGTLAGYIDKMQKDIQAKPEYQRYQVLQQGQLSDREKFQMQTAVEDRRDIRNFAQQKELAQFNNDLNRKEFLWQIENDPEKKAKALELEQKLNANKSLFDVLGKNVGTYEGNRGYDLAGNLGDPLPAGGNWKVKSIDTAGEQVGSIFISGKGSKPYGNTVVMEDENGNEIRYSHLQSIGVKPGDVLGFGDIVGTRGNTGNVRGANGETLTAEQLKAGRGAHLDVEIKSNGKLLSNADQVKFLKGLKAGGDQALTDKQFTQYNQTKTGFKSEPIVKSFEEALIAGGDIIQSLGSENGPGDVGAVFNFMKSLDPTSTVREGEFALAAKSAGVWESFKNIPANKLEGTILTDKQRKDFGKLAMKYIESKGKLYDTKYNDMVKVLENQGIPKSYYPTKMTDYVNQYKGTQIQPQNTEIVPQQTQSEYDAFLKSKGY